MSGKTTRHTGVGEPQKIHDSAIELVYSSFRNNDGDFWPQVQKACSVWLGLGRKIHGSATFLANNNEMMVPGATEDREDVTDALRELRAKTAQQRDRFVSYLMSALGNRVSFSIKQDGGIEDPAFMSQVYDFAFPMSGARVLQEQIGVRGQELYSLTQIQKFFNPEPYANDVVPNHVDNFVAAYAKYVPSETADRDEITKAFFRVMEVTNALKTGLLEDEAVARRNFAIASETLVKAAEKLAEAAPPAASFQDVDARSALSITQGFLKNVTEFRTARGQGHGVV